MGLIFRLGLRNLVKQKRRNIMLGIGIALGMMILVVANSFSHGLVDVLINDVISYSFGHLVVNGSEANSLSYTMIRDKARVVDLINNTIKKDDLIEINENLGMFAQAIGNGESDNLMLIGVDVSQENYEGFFDDFFTLVDGDFNDYFREDIQYPVILSQSKAKSLNVKVNDIINIRLPMVTGQMQTARLTVIAIANANNSFMDIVGFVQADRVKALLGYKPWESASIQITLKDPKKSAEQYADLLHEKLKPGLLSIVGRIDGQNCQLLAFQNTDDARKILEQNILIVSGDQDKAFNKDGVFISQDLAQSLNLKPGDTFIYQYTTKYRGEYQEDFTVDAIFSSDTKLGREIVLLNGENIYKTYSRYLPADSNRDFIANDNQIYPALATEWKLFERSHTAKELNDKHRVDRRIRTAQSKFDVITMYEGASDILQIEGVLNLITVIAVLILFFIILIGVINTLRMTIKERTKEIGTVRAIGMQKKDIRNVFITETFLLTLISCIAGIFLGLLLMQLLGLIEFNVNNALSMILKDGHLNFKLNLGGIFINFILIMAIAVITAYFPARRAANLSVVEALHHFE